MTSIPSLGDDVPDEKVFDESRLTPEDGLWGVGVSKPTRPPHVAATRQEIARYVVITLMVLYVGVFGVALFTALDAERFTALLAGLSGLSSLAAAVIGFYFGQAHRSER